MCRAGKWLPDLRFQTLLAAFDDSRGSGNHLCGSTGVERLVKQLLTFKRYSGPSKIYYDPKYSSSLKKKKISCRIEFAVYLCSQNFPSRRTMTNFPCMYCKQPNFLILVYLFVSSERFLAATLTILVSFTTHHHTSPSSLFITFMTTYHHPLSHLIPITTQPAKRMQYSGNIYQNCETC